MKRFSLRILSTAHPDKNPRKVLSVFTHYIDGTAEQLDGQLTELLPEESYINEARFTGFKENIDLVINWLNTSTSVSNRLVSATEDFNQNAKFITFNSESGEFIATNINGQIDPASKATILSEQRKSLVDMFEKCGALMKSTDGFHYVKPSNKHVNGFLRVSNVLETSENVSAIAFWLMPYIWKKPIKHIIVDTTGISSIAHVLAYEAVRLGGLSKLPTISSHKSYGGLDELTILDPEGTLFLVSASTSGGLSQQLIDKGAKQENIVTLFYLSEAAPAIGHTLCDLTVHEIDNPDGLAPLSNHSKSNCPECLRGSFPIKLEGDQFTLEPPKMVGVFIARDDLPKEQRDTIDLLAGTGVFKVFKNHEQRQLEIFLDIGALFPSQVSEDDPNRLFFLEIRKKYIAIARKGLPVHVKRIVYANYPFSEELAIAAEDVFNSYTPEVDNLLVPSRKLRSIQPDPETATLVISACLDDAHQLMAINRDLRVVQPLGNTTYITPIFRASSITERKRIRSSLTYGENGPNTFNLYSLIDIDLPECNKEHSWKAELKCLNEIVHWCDLKDIPIPQAISDRVKMLREITDSGMSEGLFWKSPKEVDLKVRSDFTLINTEGGKRKLTQADVYVAVSSLLLSLRLGVTGKNRLSHKPYEWVVLSPDNFTRFNDGVIQAALLRAARDYELVYSGDERMSDQFKEFILSQIKNLRAGHEDGEALMEFLMALKMRKLVLTSDHTIMVCNEVLNSGETLSEHFHIIAKFMMEQLTPNSH